MACTMTAVRNRALDTNNRIQEEELARLSLRTGSRSRHSNPQPGKVVVRTRLIALEGAATRPDDWFKLEPVYKNISGLFES